VAKQGGVDTVKDLNSYNLQGKIRCPWCNHFNTYVFNGKGTSSYPCARCRNMVLWDYDEMKGYKATILRQQQNIK
jgi:transposase-like protein